MSQPIVNAREAAKAYLSGHHIPQMFESLLSCLMIERPEDPVQYIEKKMSEIRMIGIENINWETFVLQIHPYRDPVRLQHVRDGSKFDKEREANEEAARRGDDGKIDYEPDVFKLTEAQ
ncbi:hypothetical protein ACF0H5_008346 [Mactra antiquata]